MICNHQQDRSAPQAIEPWIAALRLPRRLDSSLRAGCSFHFSEDTKRPPPHGIYSRAKLRSFLALTKSPQIITHMLTDKVLCRRLLRSYRINEDRKKVFLGLVQAKGRCTKICSVQKLQVVVGCA